MNLVFVQLLNYLLKFLQGYSCENSLETLSQVSSHSNLYSIDSDCLPNMDDVDECCHGDSNIQNENGSSNTRIVSSEVQEISCLK
jgi:hypothetical protein